MAITRTARGTGSNKASGTTLSPTTASSVTQGDLIVVYLAYDDQTLDSVTWGTQQMTLGTAVVAAGVRVRLAWCIAETTAVRTITATWAAPLVAKTIIADSFHSSVTTPGFSWLTDDSMSAQDTGTGTAASTSALAAITGGTESVTVAVVGTEGPSGDTAGTFVEPNTAGQRVGTTGNPAAGNVTGSSAYRIAPTAGSTPALSKTGMTSRDWGAGMRHFWFGSSVQNLNRTAADTTSVSDSIGRIASQFRDMADTLSVSDVVDRAKITIRSITDTISIGADAVGRVVTFARTAADTVTTVTESVARGTISFVRSASDSIPFVDDAAVRAKVVVRTIADTVSGLTESVARVANKIRTTVDTVSVTDSVARVANKIRAVADTVTIVTDSVVRAGIIKIRTALDTTTLSEGVSRAAITFGRTASDTITGVTDSVARSLQAVRTAVENIAIGVDAVSGAIVRILFRTASDTVSIGADTVTRAVSFVRGLSDTTIVSDFITTGNLVLRTVADTIFTSDAISRLITVGRSASDTVATATDSLVRQAFSIVRTTSDSISGITDSASRVANKVRAATENLSVTDSISRSWQGARSMADTLPAVVDTIFTSASVIIFRTASDTVNVVTDAISRTANMGRGAVDTVLTTDTVQKAAIYARAITDSALYLGDFVVRSGVVVRRTVEDFVPFIGDAVNFFLGVPKFIGEFVRVARSKNIWRVGRDNVDSIEGRSNVHKVRGDD